MNLEWAVDGCEWSHGMRFVWEPIPDCVSVNLALWVRAGSQYEKPSQAGLAHFLEHLFFKGSRSRSAAQIVRAIESTGGHINAFTDKEYACYSIRVLPRFLPEALDVLADMLSHPLFAPEDIEKEKGVVLEEIHRAEDSPEDLVDELYEQACWGGHPLGRTVLGTPDTVGRLQREDLLDFSRRFYRPDRMLVAASGALPSEEWLQQLAARWQASDSPPPDGEPAAPVFVPGRVWRRRRTGQLQLVLGFPACGPAHGDSYALGLLETYLGGGMSSRLFQEIRERRGWAYAVSASLIQYQPAGTFSVAVGTSSEHAAETLEVVRHEVERLLQQGIGRRQLRQTQQQLEGQLLLGLEAPEAHADWLAWGMLTFGRVVPVQEVIERYRAVEPDDVLRVARCYLASQPALACVGPVGRDLMSRWQGLLATPAGGVVPVA